MMVFHPHGYGNPYNFPADPGGAYMPPALAAGLGGSYVPPVAAPMGGAPPGASPGGGSYVWDTQTGCFNGDRWIDTYKILCIYIYLYL